MMLREAVRITNQWLVHYPAWFGDNPESLARLPRTRINAALRGDIELARKRLKELAQSVGAAQKILRRLEGTKPRAGGAKKKKPGGRSRKPSARR